LKRKQPPVTGKIGDDLFDNGVSQCVLVLEVVVEGPFGDFGGGQNGIDPGALEAVFVNLAKSRFK
jgi:hypothetical protein